MLPHIHGEQSLLTVGEGEISVGGFGDLQSAVLDDQPGPAAAELGGASGLELLHEGVVAAEVGIDLVEKGTSGLTTTTGLHALPVEAVVPDLSCVVEHAGLAGVTGNRRNHLFQAFSIEIRSLDRLVQVGDVAVVVLAVVKLERGAGDVGLQCIEGVGQRREGMGHGEGNRAAGS